MRLHEVLPALLAGQPIRQASSRDLQIILGVGGESGPRLVMYSPGSKMEPMVTSFSTDDVLAEDWEVAE